MAVTGTAPVAPITVDWSQAVDKLVPQITATLTLVAPVAGGLLALFIAWALIKKMLDVHGQDEWQRAGLDEDDVSAYEKALITQHNEDEGW